MEMVFLSRTLLNLAQLLVRDALRILSSISRSHNSSETASSSFFVRFLSKFFDILRSLSFLQSLSQEEPLVSLEASENIKTAMQLLTKAAESENSDARYLLGELNFVLHAFKVPLISIVRELLESKLSRSVQMVPATSSDGWKFHGASFIRIHVRNRNR